VEELGTTPLSSECGSFCEHFQLPPVPLRKPKKFKRARPKKKSGKHLAYFVDGYETSKPSSDTSDHMGPRKIFAGMPDGSSDCPGLEGPTVVPVVKDSVKEKICTKLIRKSAKERARNESEGSMPPAGENSYTFINKQNFDVKKFEGGNSNGNLLRALMDQVRNEGKKKSKLFLEGLMRFMGKSDWEIKAVFKAYEESTISNYLWAWNKFMEFLDESNDYLDCFESEEFLNDLYVLYLEWLVEENPEGELVNIPASAYNLAKSGVASLLSSIFNINLADRKWNKLLAKAFQKEHPSKPRHFTVWQITDLLNYLRNFSSDFNEFEDPITESFMFLQRKTAALLMTFAFNRPAELNKHMDVFLDG
jgi:hypothetical protein